jgi:hypothetical protein
MLSDIAMMCVERMTGRPRVSHEPDRLSVVFDDTGLVANAGLILVATLAARLGLSALGDATVRLGDRSAGFAPGRKVLTIVHAMGTGGSHIDQADLLRSGATARVLGRSPKPTGIPTARAYLQRRKDAGDTTKEAIPVLKRRLSDVVYRALLADSDPAASHPAAQTLAPAAKR